MPDAWEPPSRGALDDTAWPDRLKGRAIACEASDHRLFGYAVVADVARNYAFSDLVYLGLVGELPDVSRSRHFAVALCAAATISVAEAPVHAAVLARLSGSTFASSLATGLVIVADRARQIVADHAALLAWLGSSDPLPVEFRSQADLAWVEQLAAVAGVALPHTTRAAALIVLFHAAGLRRAEQFEAALVAAQITSVSAEALETGPQHLAEYPVKTPEFRYVEGRIPSPEPTGIATRNLLALRVEEQHATLTESEIAEEHSPAAYYVDEADPVARSPLECACRHENGERHTRHVDGSPINRCLDIVEDALHIHEETVAPGSRRS